MSAYDKISAIGPQCSGTNWFTHILSSAFPELAVSRAEPWHHVSVIPDEGELMVLISKRPDLWLESMDRHRGRTWIYKLMRSVDIWWDPKRAFSRWYGDLLSNYAAQMKGWYNQRGTDHILPVTYLEVLEDRSRVFGEIEDLTGVQQHEPDEIETRVLGDGTITQDTFDPTPYLEAEIDRTM